MAEVIAVLQYWVGNTTLQIHHLRSQYVASKMEGPKLRITFSACHVEDVSYSSPLFLIIRVIIKKTKTTTKKKQTTNRVIC